MLGIGSTLNNGRRTKSINRYNHNTLRLLYSVSWVRGAASVIKVEVN